MAGLTYGDIANEYGDLTYGDARPIAEGAVTLPISKALVALRYGWHWTASNGDDCIDVIRGGKVWRARR